MHPLASRPALLIRAESDWLRAEALDKEQEVLQEMHGVGGQYVLGAHVAEQGEYRSRSLDQQDLYQQYAVQKKLMINTAITSIISLRKENSYNMLGMSTVNTLPVKTT